MYFLSRPPPNWRRSIGIQVGSFVSISRIKQKNTPPPTFLLDPASNEQLSNYFRFLEISPYIEWENRTNGIGFRTNLLYSAANHSKPLVTQNALARQQSFGMGIETNYAIIRRRWNLATYLKFQGEHIYTHYSNGNGGSASIEANDTANGSYQQWVVSGEAGIRCSYVLPTPYWRLHGTIGYRNYFWQQSLSNNQSVLKLPSLLQLGLGISIDL